MLENKIIKAKAKEKKQLIKIVVFVISVLIICSILLWFFSCCKVVFRDSVVSTEPNLSSGSKNNIEIDKQTPSAISNNTTRDLYIDLLNYYENKISPEISNIEIDKNYKQDFEEITLLKDDSANDFSLSKYSTSYTKLKKAKELAEKIIADSQKQFSAYLLKAQEAYDIDDYETAKLSIEKASIFNKESSEAINLANKIKKMPEFISLIKRSNIARIENNHEKELALVKGILKIIPDRESIISRKNELVNLISEKKFNSHIKKSFDAINKNDLTTAKLEIKNAKHFFPNSSKIKTIENEIKKIEKNNRIRQYKNKISTSMKNDDWVETKKYLEFYLQESKDKADILALLDKTTKIIHLKKELRKFIDNPYGLSNEHVLSKANKTLNSSDNYIEFSHSLENDTLILKDIIKKISSKIPITIVSDNKTTILVRGVGRVGKTKSKIIKLTPGKYTFEGKRKGYKSKLIEILISYEVPSYKIDIVCDEPI